ncbi:MAG: hypothetical protein ACOY3J_11860 [Bacillota bacterium]|uniref:Uncharacterized protein n=1 Tax=Thermanaerosceptrum fracticalcis TaxID=1712410 RepID=A0A7G6E0M7_THEFR|nr:hypothetical protein [Thermanaerosceptrum fracticalcis]QNB45631.1 hypothetical protein BR63_04445 [Thermanaerosceptrum fracticalcis]
MSLPSRRTKREKKKNYLFYFTVLFLAFLSLVSLFTENYPALVLMAGLSFILSLPRLFSKNPRLLHRTLLLVFFFVIWLGVFLGVIP